MGHTNGQPDQGVQFQVLDGKRSSQLVGKHVFAEAAAAADSSLASKIAAEPNWRKGYLTPVRELVEAGARSPKDAVRIATDGLRAAQDSFVFNGGGDQQPLVEALRRPRATLETAAVRGERDPWTEVVVPYRGSELRGDALLRQLDSWEKAGIIEPSCAAAVRRVVSRPEWLDLSDVRVVLLGAASEMGPLEWLCRWGAEVIAVDLPRRELWERIIAVARNGSGTLHAPVAGAVPTGDDALADAAGADLLTQTPEIAAWLSIYDGPLVVGNYAYADGSTFLRLAAALDSLTLMLQEERPDVAISYLATPTDAFAVPQEIVDAALSRKSRAAPLSSATRMATGGRVFGPNYAHTVTGADGRSWSISDVLVPQQGPNYALAKMIQRWRATISLSDGHLTSANVAPATLTRSVIKNRVLAAAYRGASAFGVEVFGGTTSRALMSALLVHDLRDPHAPANPQVELEHPYDLFTHAAAHGGLWRLAHEPRTVLPLAVGLGLLKRY